MANKIPLVIADFETQISGAIGVGDTSFTLASATDDDGNSLPAGKYCFTINNGSSNKQYLLGQLNSLSVTSVVTVSRQGVETSGAAVAARSGSPVIISDFAAIQRVVDILRGEETLDGTSPIIYDAEPTLADRKELATVGYVLDTASGGTVAFDSQIISGTAGEAIVAGNLVYFKTSDQEWYKTDADTAATVEGVQLGIALGTGSDGVAITSGVQISGTWTTTGLTAGALYYASNTAGAIATSAGTTSRVVGIALSTTKLLIIPRTPKSLKDAQEDALAGYGGTPSGTNPYTVRAKSVTAGATINGATLPVPVYQNTTDNEYYACDGNDTAALKFQGFAISNGTDGNAMNVQFTGIVNGFTGLDEGVPYYLSDTVGTIQNTPGTYEVLVGVAISSTELLIQKGKHRSSGTLQLSSSGNTDITVGFRVSSVRIHAKVADNSVSAFGMSSGGWTATGGNDCSYMGNHVGDATAGWAGTATLAYFAFTDVTGTTVGHQGIVSTITATTFRIENTEQSTGGDVYIYWEAEGDF